MSYMDIIKLRKNIKVNAWYIATPKKIPEPRMIKEDDVPDEIEYNYRFLENGFFWKTIEFEVPKIIVDWYNFWYPNRWVDKCYEYYEKRSKK